MMILVHYLQIVFGVVWLVPLLQYSPGVIRVLFKRADILDVVRTPLWAASLVMVAGSTRWLVWPDAMRGMETPELTFWSMVYILGIAAGFANIALIRVGNKLLAPNR